MVATLSQEHRKVLLGFGESFFSEFDVSGGMLGAMSAPSGAECQRSPLKLYKNNTQENQLVIEIVKLDQASTFQATFGTLGSSMG